MEGDLLGLGLEQPAVSSKTSSEVQLFESSFLHMQQPAGQVHPLSQLQPAGQVPPLSQVQPAGQVPPLSQVQPAAVQLESPFINVQQSSVQYQHVVAQQHEQPVLHQSLSTSKPVQETITSNNNLQPAPGSTFTAQYIADAFAGAAPAVWKPSPLHDEPKDPVLREIKEKFSGRWKLIRSDPYDEYLKAAGVGFFARKLAITRPPEQEISIKGNKIHIDFHSTFHNQIHVFMLEESVENLVETSRQSVFCSYKDGKLILLMTPLEPGLNRTQEVQRYINEHGELVVIHTCGTSTCRRYFARMADIVAPLNIVG